MTAARIEAFLAEAGWAEAERQALAGDASARRYERLRQAGFSAILMVAPVATASDRKSLESFLRVGSFLRDLGLSAPEVYAADHETGLLLLQDFGDVSLARLLGLGQGAAAYRQAAAIPFDLARAGLPHWCATPDHHELADMVALTFEELGGAARFRRDVQAGLKTALDEFCTGSPVLSLRDYHGENLIWRSGQTGRDRIGLLDFQDAVALPCGYDLASLIDDPRRDVPDALRQDLVSEYAAQLGRSETDAFARIDTLSLLRNLRILGIFRRLARSEKPKYRSFLPRTARLIARAAANPALADLRAPIAETLARAAPWSEGLPA